MFTALNFLSPMAIERYVQKIRKTHKFMYSALASKDEFLEML